VSAEPLLRRREPAGLLREEPRIARRRPYRRDRPRSSACWAATGWAVDQRPRRSWAWSDATGTIEFKSHDLTRLKTFEIAHLGIGYVPGNRDIFPTLTVEENLASRRQAWTRLGLELCRRLPAVSTAAGPCSHPGGRTGQGAEQQMLTLARTMMGDPQLVSSMNRRGLAPMIVELVGTFLRELARPPAFHPLIEQKTDESRCRSRSGYT